MSKTTFGKIVCALSAAAVLAALQFAAPASAAIEPFIAGQPDSVQQAANTLPAPVQPAVDAQADSDDANAMAPEPDTSTPAADPRQVECMAKVIIHEAANQPRRGRAAVAQVIHARMHDARFAKNACAVVRQRGQFFNVDAYNPRRDTTQWQDAVAIATQTLNGQGEDPVPGALFFHAVGSPMRGHTALGRIDGHLFYR